MQLMKIEREQFDNYPHNLSWVTFMRYYPVRYDVSAEYNFNRQFVFGFKDGNSIPAIDQLFIKEIQQRKAAQSGANFWLCTIPASSIAKTQNRFQHFCHRVSGGASVNNGFMLLQCKEDRPEVHIGSGNGRDYSRVLSSIQFGQVSGKNILLCDDVATMGKSYRIVARHLIELGATSVYGMMLAKTHWQNEVDTSNPFFIL